MNEVKTIIDYYNQYYSTIIKDNLALLIEAFTKYYGEQWRDYITYTLNNVIFMWFLSPFSQQKYNERVCSQITSERIKYTRDILFYLGYLINDQKLKIAQKSSGYDITQDSINPGIIKNIFEIDGQKIDYILNYLFGSSLLFNFNYSEDKIYNFYNLTNSEQIEFLKTLFHKDTIDTEIQEKLKKAQQYLEDIEGKDNKEKIKNIALICNYIKNTNPSRKITGVFRNEPASLNYNMLYNCDLYINTDLKANTLAWYSSFIEVTTKKVNKMIVFPIIFTSDSTFIHELNHAITSSVLAYSEFLDIEKSGIYVSDENKKKKNTLLFEELLNHKSAMEIANIFYELGGTLFNNEHSFNANIQSEHELFFPLINEFYEKYKDLLKEARISENRNILFRDMDYQQFYNLNYQINHVYRSKKISYRDLKKNNKLVLNLVKKDS